MLTISELKGLRVGDKFNASGLLRGVSDEPVVLTLVEETNKSDFIFEMRYFGVDIGQIGVTIRKGVVGVERF